MYRGNFTIRDREDSRLPLRFLGEEGGCLRFAHPDLAGEYRLRVSEEEGLLHRAKSTKRAFSDAIFFTDGDTVTLKQLVQSLFEMGLVNISQVDCK